MEADNGTLGFVFGALLSGVVGLAVWRCVLGQTMWGEAEAGEGTIAVALAAGLVAGTIASASAGDLMIHVNAFSSAALAAKWSETGLSHPSLVLGYSAAWFLVVLGSAIGLVAWLVAGARVWINLALTRPSPRVAYLGSFVAGWVVFVYWLQYLLSVEPAQLLTTPTTSLISLLRTLVESTGMFWVRPEMIGFWLLIAIYPLIPWVWLGCRKSVESRWPFLDLVPRPVNLSPGPIEPGASIRAGLIGGLIAWLAVTTFLAALPIAIVATAILVMTSGIVWYQRGGRLGWIQGLFAAQISSLVFLVGYQVSLGLVFGRLDVSGSFIVTMATVINLPAILLVGLAAFHRAIGARRSRPGSHRAAGPAVS